MSKKIRKKYDILSITLLVCLILYSLSMILTILWGVGTSLKTYPQFRKDPVWFPSGSISSWKWDNYSNAFEFFKVSVGKGSNQRDVKLFEMFIYSFLYAGGCAFFATFIPLITAYATARYEFKFSKAVYAIVLITMALPIIGSLPSEIQLVRALCFDNKIWGVWMMKGHFLSMYYLVFHAFTKGISKEYYEAAYIDGAGESHIFISIILPLYKNIFFTIFLLQFITFWNDYQTPLLYLSDYPPVALGLYKYNIAAETGTSWPPMKVTGSILMAIPTLAIFLVFNQKLVGNITLGGVKE